MSSKCQFSIQPVLKVCHSCNLILWHCLSFEKQITCVFDTDNQNPHISVHYFTSLIALCILLTTDKTFLPLFHIAPSSAKRDFSTPAPSWEKMSLIITLNMMGLHTLPWGVGERLLLRLRPEGIWPTGHAHISTAKFLSHCTTIINIF